MATEHFLNWIEGQAHGLRELCGLGTFDRLEPVELARRMEVEVIDPTHIQSLPKQTLDILLVEDSTAWSAGTLYLPNGKIIVVMNPGHEKTRKRASLMEELAHVRLKHKPSRLISMHGLTVRTWKNSDETEAYWVGAAALLPRRVMKGARTIGLTIEKLADRHGVSVELVKFRENVLGIKLERSISCAA